MTKTEVVDDDRLAGAQEDNLKRSGRSTGHRRDLFTFWVAATTGIVLWTAFPPVGAGWLAWIAPAGWVWLALQPQLRGRRPYLQLYVAGTIHQLLMIQWVRLPHWSAYFGWLALAGYLACYLPAFIGLTRVAIHRWKLPAFVAAPCIWVGLELFRSYFLTGFSVQLLSHTQVNYLPVIQCADLFGAYSISFAIVCVASCLAQLSLIHGSQRRRAWAPLLVAAAMLASVLGYGNWRLRSPWTVENAVAHSVALIQGSIDTTFEEDNRIDALRQYYALTGEAVRERPNLSLIVWPESMYAYEWIELVEPVSLPTDSPLTIEQLNKLSADNQRTALDFARQVGRPLLVGSPGTRYVNDRVERYNSAMWLTPAGEVIRYNKMHPVVFGEFVPGGQWVPWLYRLTPMPSGLTRGQAPAALPLQDIRLCPNICFENTVPHLLRRQVRELTADGTPLDVLVTITNDGWFWGSSLLDVHLACGILRAVELRRPLVIAANTGFSASIDAHGRVLAKGPRRDTGIVWAEVARRINNTSLYERQGDVAAGLCSLLCLLMGVSGLRR